MIYSIGETYYPTVYVGSIGETPRYSMMRVSDSKFWDFDREIWSLTPDNKFSEDMTESANWTGLFVSELDTTFLTEDVEILFIYSCPSYVGMVRVQFEKDLSVEVSSLVVYNRTTEQTTISCIGKINQEIILTPSRVTFSILDVDGATELEETEETTSVNGVFKLTTGLFEPQEGYGYILNVVYEYSGQSYSFSMPFTVV